MEERRLDSHDHIRTGIESGSAWIENTGKDRAPTWCRKPDPVQADPSKIANDHEEFAMLPRRTVGICPSRGRALVHDIRLVKHHSAGLGAPRASTGIAPSYIRNIRRLLAESAPETEAGERSAPKSRS